MREYSCICTLNGRGLNWKWVWFQSGVGGVLPEVVVWKLRLIRLDWKLLCLLFIIKVFTEQSQNWASDNFDPESKSWNTATLARIFLLHKYRYWHILLVWKSTLFVQDTCFICTGHLFHVRLNPVIILLPQENKSLK